MERDLNNRQPYYALIAEELMREIRMGRFPPGSLIPTEPELCKRFSVSRVTVRGALRELEVRGMITRRRGVGTRVETVDTQSRFVHETGSVDDVLRFPDELAFRLLDRREIQIDDSVASKLDAQAGERYVRVEGLRVPAGSDLPVCLTAHFLPACCADVVERMDGLKGSLAQAVAEASHVEIDEIEQVIDAVNLDKREAGLLHAKTRDAALLTWRRYWNDAGALLLASRSLFPKDRSSYLLHSKRSGPRKPVTNLVNGRKRP
jgi:DNA-binding GntR family transcriptional regulator